jgi:DNA helicase-2/ATP-dependent DNA helicase PcrA
MEFFTPRPAQERVLEYTGGTMGIAAVPGSGKTHTLSALAAKLILEGFLDEGQEILVVTLTNSAVDNFSTRINAFLESASRRPLLPPYRVRTLHGLAHDIVRERPDLVGLDSTFQIVDEREANNIRREAANAWLRVNAPLLNAYLDPALDDNRVNWLRRERLPALVEGIALAFIRTAKDMRLTPDDVQAQLARVQLPLPLAKMGADIYADYQRALAYRGAVDFDDLIRLALHALEADPEFLARLRERWPYILEDEAQDSSRLQEMILRQLAGEGGNWVRVGDPNQAIFESFTTASPEFLRRFLREADFPRELPNSGRSTRSIIALANELIRWTREEHPVPEARDALDTPFIEPTPEGDPQPNPPDRPDQVYLVPTAYPPANEVEAVARSLADWVPRHPERTVAVLVPRNQRGFELQNELKKYDLIVHDGLLRATLETRRTAGALTHILQYLSDPKSARKLANVYKVWQREAQEDAEIWAEVETVAGMIAKIPRVEDFLWPRPDSDWLDSLDLTEVPQIRESLLAFREQVQNWQGAVLLPVDQVILTLAQDLFTTPTDLAIAHKLAVLLRQAERAHPDWHLHELAGELAVIAKNERRFLGFSEDDSGFDPDAHPGEVVIATIHKAKGLEWDRVYLMSVNSYNFPAGEETDRYISEKWFVRDNLNLEAETLAQLEAAFQPDAFDWYVEGAATRAARLEYVRERLRLLYVGITRAREELVITWNAGRTGGHRPPLRQAVAFAALQRCWDSSA